MITLQRWSGNAWYDTMMSPFKNHVEVSNHLKKYWWHYTTDNPYRIIDTKPKKQKDKNLTKRFLTPSSKDDYVVVNKVIY